MSTEDPDEEERDVLHSQKEIDAAVHVATFPLHIQAGLLRDKVASLQTARRRWIDAIAVSLPRGWNTPDEATMAISAIVRVARLALTLPPGNTEEQRAEALAVLAQYTDTEARDAEE